MPVLPEPQETCAREISSNLKYIDMENFIAYNPTELHFGKGIVSDLGDVALKYGNTALLLYGKGSVLKNGSYQDTINQLKKRNIKIVEFNGIKPNPLVEDVRDAVEKGKKNEVDFVVAVGGGSVIDSAKVISVCLAGSIDPWDFMKSKVKPEASFPLIAVLTLAATGTEMNSAAVLQNAETREKIGLRHSLMYPTHSFLDPAYTLSVPGNYTAYGIADLIAHCLEAWFGEGESTLSDRFVVAIIQEALEYGPELLQNLNDYDLRSKIMWAATNALNNLTTYGKLSGDWGVHAIGHILSFLYDTPHGATLSIVYPAWMKHHKGVAAERLIKLGEMLFNTSDIDRTILEVEKMFSAVDCPVRAEGMGIPLSEKQVIIDLANRNGSGGLNYRLNDEDREKIISLIF